MRRLLFLTGRAPDRVLPAARSLGLDVKVEPPDTDALLRIPDLAPDAVVIDAVEEPDRAFSLLQALAAARPRAALVVVLDRATLAAFAWHDVVDDFVLPDVEAEELRLRLELVQARRGESGDEVVRLGAVAINVESYRVTAGGRPLDLTFKEFELLRFLADNPGRVYTRARLLQEVWGYDFYGGTRTVDVHVRRLRAKLGPEHEHLIETVRGVGYRGTAGP